MLERIRMAQVAPAQAPKRLPASRLSTTSQCGARLDHGTVMSRAGRAVRDHDEAEGLVDDDGLQRGEAEQHDQQREAELGAAQADHAAEDADGGPAGEGQGQRRADGAGAGRSAGYSRCDLLAVGGVAVPGGADVGVLACRGGLVEAERVRNDRCGGLQDELAQRGDPGLDERGLQRLEPTTKGGVGDGLAG